MSSFHILKSTYFNKIPSIQHFGWPSLLMIKFTLEESLYRVFFHIGQHSQGGGFFAQVLYSRCLSNDTQRGWCFWICFDLPHKLITSFVGENAVGFEDILYPLINFISCVNHHGLHFVERSSEVITLGSRQSLCINESLRSRARGAGHLNDLCRRGIPARWKHRRTDMSARQKPPTFLEQLRQDIDTWYYLETLRNDRGWHKKRWLLIHIFAWFYCIHLILRNDEGHTKNGPLLICCCFYYKYFLLVCVSWLSMATQ